jgi:hypothetical protein
VEVFKGKEAVKKTKPGDKSLGDFLTDYTFSARP